MQVQLNVTLSNGNQLATPCGSPEDVADRIRGVADPSVVNVSATVACAADVTRLKKLLDVIAENWSSSRK